MKERKVRVKKEERREQLKQWQEDLENQMSRRFMQHKNSIVSLGNKLSIVNSLKRKKVSLILQKSERSQVQHQVRSVVLCGQQSQWQLMKQISQKFKKIQEFQEEREKQSELFITQAIRNKQKLERFREKYLQFK